MTHFVLKGLTDVVRESRPSLTFSVLIKILVPESHCAAPGSINAARRKLAAAEAFRAYTRHRASL